MTKLSDDLLYGAERIAEFLYGSKSARRKVYHNGGSMPVFRMGSILCARKSQLIAWIDEQEQLARQGKFKKSA
jgi:hypothetical protein